jgi:hypothetical protein
MRLPVAECGAVEELDVLPDVGQQVLDNNNLKSVCALTRVAKLIGCVCFAVGLLFYLLADN